MKKSKLEFFSLNQSSELSLPLFNSRVSAGFPSPADDYVDVKLDLNQHLIQHPSATFYVKVHGESMRDAGIFDGDLLIVDRALTPKNNAVVVCILNGDFTVKRIKFGEDKRIFLMPANETFSPIEVTANQDFEIWGVVSYIIHKA